MEVASSSEDIRDPSTVETSPPFRPPGRFVGTHHRGHRSRRFLSGNLAHRTRLVSGDGPRTRETDHGNTPVTSGPLSRVSNSPVTLIQVNEGRGPDSRSHRVVERLSIPIPVYPPVRNPDEDWGPEVESPGVLSTPFPAP